MPKASAPAKPKYADNVLGFQRINPALIRPHPKNPRVHLTRQREVLRAMLSKYGVVDALVVRKISKTGYELINGHLRLEELKDQPTVPCLVVKANDAQAAKMLATYDSISAAATINQNAMKQLIQAQGAISEEFKPIFEHMMGRMTAMEDYAQDIDLERQFGIAEAAARVEPEDDEEEETGSKKTKAKAAPPADTNLVNLYYQESDHEAFVAIIGEYREAKGGETIPVPAIVLDIMREAAAVA